MRRVPAAEIEALVISSVRAHLKPSTSIDDRGLINTHIARVEVQPQQLVIQLARAQKANRPESGKEGVRSVSHGTRRRQSGGASFFCQIPFNPSTPGRSDPRHARRWSRQSRGDAVGSTSLSMMQSRRRRHREAREMQRAPS